jgi:glycosyltransferase involved in cell wall biosynthesis
VIGSLEVGGAEMHLAQILPRLVRSGFEVAVHTISGRGELAGRLEAAGVEVIVPPGAGPSAGRSPAQRSARAARALISLARYYRRWRPDVVHFFLPEAYIVGALLALPFRFKRVMSRRSLNDYQTKHPWMAWIERRLHRRMHALIGNAQAVVDQLVGEGAPAERVHLIRNGVDVARFEAVGDEARAALGVTADTLLLLIVANLIPYKGHADLLAALAQINAKLPPWCLLCAGRDDGVGPLLQGSAQALGIGSRVRLLGSRNDVPDLLKAADIVVLASHEEGFPNAVIEAMAAGRPVIGTRVGGVAEAIIDGETGVIVPPHHPAEMAKALMKLASDPALRSRMGAAGRARAQSEFGLEICVARYAALYRGLSGA